MSPAFKLLIGLLLVMFTLQGIGAPTPAGTTIRNQATATYRDGYGQVTTVTSNLVETVIEQVPGLLLVSEQTQRTIAGNDVTFAHRITNTGNGDDRYVLTTSNNGSDDFNLSSLFIFADVDANGIADNSTPIVGTPWLAAGSTYNVVISGIAPPGTSLGEVATISLQAQSSFDATLSDTNIDTVEIDDGAIIEVTKSLSVLSGLSPSGPFSVTLSYVNTGNTTAVDVVILDALQTGMSYVENSARWSELAAALTDQDPNDPHGSGAQTIRFCAYHSTCTGLPEAATDPDTSSTNQLTAIIGSVSSGDSGSITFDVTIDGQLEAASIFNIAEFEYMDDGNLTTRANSNTVVFSILNSAGVVANGSQATPLNTMNEPVYHANVAQGGIVYYENIIWNTGNTTDTFNIEVDNLGSTFPPGTLFQLLKGDSATPLQDSNSDGSVDTGPVSPGQYSVVVLRLNLPAGVSGNNSGFGFDISKTARSVSDASISDLVTDHLDEIVGNLVDLTNQAPAGTTGALGVGPGPEALPVSSVVMDDNYNAVFDLFIRHQGFGVDSYNLSANATSSGGALPAGWSVKFTDVRSGTQVSNTGSLESGEATHILATVSADPSYAAGSYSIYFQVDSLLTGASDIKHDAVIIDAQKSLTLTPNLSAQLQPGGTVVYKHVITNTGTVIINTISLQQSNDQSGWNSLVYQDSDADDNLGASDVLISGNFNLQPGESRTIFNKVFSPATALTLQSNTTTTQAIWGVNHDTVSVTDISTINKSHVAIRKEQVADTGCDGQPDNGQEFGPGHIEVAPGNNCIIYRLTAINRGTEPSYNVTIHDSTPPFTNYQDAAACSRSPCWITEPATGDTGTITAETDQLLPGDGFFLQFSVSVE